MYKNNTIHSLFEQCVNHAADKIAITFADKNITYKELNKQANQLAYALRAKYKKLTGYEISRDTVLALCLDRDIDCIVALLGILKAGAAYVNLDKNYPRERLHFMLKDTGAKLVITKSEVVNKMPFLKDSSSIGLNYELICLDSEQSFITKMVNHNPVSINTPADLAYIVYTSGSTGTPKGVMGTHIGAINRFNWMWREYPFTAKDRFCLRTPLNFVRAVWEIFVSLLQGVHTILVSEVDIKDHVKFYNLLVNNAVSRIVITPSLLDILLIEWCNDNYKAFNSLTHIFVSGEPFSNKLARKFLSIPNHPLLINLYGSSESTSDGEPKQEDMMDHILNPKNYILQRADPWKKCRKHLKKYYC